MKNVLHMGTYHYLFETAAELPTCEQLLLDTKKENIKNETSSGSFTKE